MDDNGGSWDDKSEYFSKSRLLYHNDDYLRFLITEVWRIDSPVLIVDYGCGTGYLASKLLPNIPAGSRYLGLDQSEALIKEARSLHGHSEHDCTIVQADVFGFSPPVKADISFTHTVLMHLGDPERLIRHMVEQTRAGGMVICCETNWTAAMSLVHLDGLIQSSFMNLSFLQRDYEQVAARTGKDGNIGIKLPIYFERAGLHDIQCRASDRVNFYSSGDTSEESRLLLELMKAEGIGFFPSARDEVERKRREQVSLGISDDEADEQLDRERAVAEYVQKTEPKRIVFAPAMMFTSGIVGEGPT
jgi:SAM-dependent methyltransferase